MPVEMVNFVKTFIEMEFLLCTTMLCNQKTNNRCKRTICMNLLL